MRRAIDNPFTPGSDTVPIVWAGRVQQLRDWEDVVRPRRVAGISERGRTILGEAGLGKSTLVRRIARMAEDRGDWVTPQLRVPLGTDPLKLVAASMLGLADRAGLAAARERRVQEALERVRSVSAYGISMSADRRQGPEPYAALTELMIEIGVHAIRQDTTVLIHLDEVQNIDDEAVLSQLLVAFGDAITHETTVDAPGGVRISRVLPIAVYLTGLPEFAALADARKGATFARRFATTTLEPLDDADLLLALRPFVDPGWEVAGDDGSSSRVRMDDGAARAIVRLCQGEPFLFQLAGERAWYAGSGSVITEDDVRHGWRAARREATAYVERVLERLPGRERQFLETMATMSPEERTATAIARAMGLRTAAQAGPTAQRLDTIRGIISRGGRYTFRHRAIEGYLTSSWPEVD